MRLCPRAPHSPPAARHHPDGVLSGARFDSPNITETVTNVNVIVTYSVSYASALATFLTYVTSDIKLTHMEKTQVYLRKEELNALRKAAARSKRSVAALVREAIRKVVLMPPAEGPVAIWDG